jgi:hypothetical protein
MNQNRQKMLERGEKLNEVEDKAAALNDHASVSIYLSLSLSLSLSILSLSLSLSLSPSLFRYLDLV